MKWLLYVLLMPKIYSIMQRALCILLSSVEIISQLIVGAIFFSFGDCYNTMAVYKDSYLGTSQVGKNHMSSAIYCVYKKCQNIKEILALILQHTFIMNIFSKLYRTLTELKEYLNWYRGEKNNWVHACNKK